MKVEEGDYPWIEVTGHAVATGPLGRPWKTRLPQIQTNAAEALLSLRREPYARSNAAVVAAMKTTPIEGAESAIEELDEDDWLTVVEVKGCVTEEVEELCVDVVELLKALSGKEMLPDAGPRYT